MHLCNLSCFTLSQELCLPLALMTHTHTVLLTEIVLISSVLLFGSLTSASHAHTLLRLQAKPNPSPPSFIARSSWERSFSYDSYCGRSSWLKLREDAQCVSKMKAS